MSRNTIDPATFEVSLLSIPPQTVADGVPVNGPVVDMAGFEWGKVLLLTTSASGADSVLLEVYSDDSVGGSFATLIGSFSFVPSTSTLRAAKWRVSGHKRFVRPTVTPTGGTWIGAAAIEQINPQYTDDAIQTFEFDA